MTKIKKIFFKNKQEKFEVFIQAQLKRVFELKEVKAYFKFLSIIDIYEEKFRV